MPVAEALEKIDVSSFITRDSEIMGGQACFKGTRVPIQALFDHLEAGEALESFFDGYPRVTRTQVYSALEVAKQSLL